MVADTYQENAGVSLFAEGDFEINAVLVVEALTEDGSYDIRKSITHIPHWELFKVEE